MEGGEGRDEGWRKEGWGGMEKGMEKGGIGRDGERGNMRGERAWSDVE